MQGEKHVGLTRGTIYRDYKIHHFKPKCLFKTLLPLNLTIGSQPTAQPEIPEPPIFTKGKKNSVNSTKVITTVEPARVTPLPTISASISSLDVQAA